MDALTKTLTSSLTVKKILGNKHINFIIKTVIVLLLLWAIYQQVFAKENARNLYDSFVKHFSGLNILWLLTVVLLVPVNWGLETRKWHILIRKFTKYSFLEVYKATLAGITVSLFTPNRVGEYGGRILLVEAKDNWRAAIATVVGSFSQLLVLLSMGLLGLLFFSWKTMDIPFMIMPLLIFFGVIGIGLMLFGFFNIDLFVPLAKRIPFPLFIKKYLRHLIVLNKFTTKELSNTLSFAFIRYAVYSFQYYLILQFFDIEVPFLLAMSGIATIYLLQTSIPLPPVMGLLARSQVALQIWNNFSNSNTDILAASFSLFIINLTIPALIGTVFIMQTNVMKSLGYEGEEG